MEQPITALFYGISGSGKGTQAELLVKYLELEAAFPNTALYIETGEALRGFIRSEGHTQKLAAEFLAKGTLLPSFLPIYLWVSALVDQFKGTEHIILDGTARRETEAEVLDSALEFYGRPDYHVFVLEISDEVALERLRSRARVDDKGNEEGMRNKLNWYKEHVLPCITAFERKGKAVHHINGEQPIEAIHHDILRALGMEKAV